MLSLNNILLLFKNLLLERGVYIISRDPRRAFGVIEAASSLIYPLRWDLPKILSYEPNYEFFMSPIPLIYYFNGDKFKAEGLKGMDLTDKCLVYLDSDAIHEYCATPGLEELPPKLLSSLLKQLEITAGPYNCIYIQRRSFTGREQYENMLEKEDDTTPFDYWRTREIFFDFMKDLLEDYVECYKETRLLMADNISSGEIFDFIRFAKSKTGLKNNTFIQSFMKTSLFSRFVECRIHPESPTQEIYYSYFDCLHKAKSSSSKNISMKSFLDKVESKGTIDCPPPNSFGFEDYLISYSGMFPILDPDLCTTPRQAIVERPGFALDDHIESLQKEYIEKTTDEKWARSCLEMLHTVWFLCLKIHLKDYAYSSSLQLINLAYDRFLEMESEKIPFNLDIVRSLAFILGIFRESSKFSRMFRKSGKIITDRNQSATVYAEYIKGTQIKINKIDPAQKMIKYSDGSPDAKSMYSEDDFQHFDIKDMDEEERDSLVPISIKSYFETNAFCSKCATYIPEEIILAKMLKDPESTKAVCPNQACLFEYEPVLKIVFLKEKGSNKEGQSTKLYSPLKLLLSTRKFIEKNNAEDLLKVEIAGDLYWNIIFYTNFLNLPGFFIQKIVNNHVLDYSLKNLKLYQFDEILGQYKAGGKTTINNSGDNSIDKSVSISLDTSSRSPDKLPRTISHNSTASHITQPKFSFKKDL